MKKQNLTWVSTVAAMLAASGLGVRAQDTPAPPAPPASDMGTGTDSTTTATDTTTTTTTTGTMNNGMSGGMSTSSMSTMSSGSMSSDHPDYLLLADPNLDYTDLKQAEATGLGDDNVARISKMARITAVPFRDILDAVLRGETFFKLIDKYSLNVSDLDDVSDEKMRIAAYLAAYESSGSNGYKRFGSAQDTELEAHFARFRELNASFPATATASTLTFQRGPAPEPTPMAAATETTTVRAARTEETTTETVKAAPMVKAKPVRTVMRVSHVRRARHYTVRRRHTMRVHRHHQVHHHLPRHVYRGS